MFAAAQNAVYCGCGIGHQLENAKKSFCFVDLFTAKLCKMHESSSILLVFSNSFACTDRIKIMNEEADRNYRVTNMCICVVML